LLPSSRFAFILRPVPLLFVIERRNPQGAVVQAADEEDLPTFSTDEQPAATCRVDFGRGQVTPGVKGVVYKHRAGSVEEPIPDLRTPGVV
jgi:hypothetical protein